MFIALINSLDGVYLEVKFIFCSPVTFQEEPPYRLSCFFPVSQIIYMIRSCLYISGL